MFFILTNMAKDIALELGNAKSLHVEWSKHKIAYEFIVENFSIECEPPNDDESISKGEVRILYKPDVRLLNGNTGNLHKLNGSYVNGEWEYLIPALHKKIKRTVTGRLEDDIGTFLDYYDICAKYIKKDIDGVNKRLHKHNPHLSVRQEGNMHYFYYDDKLKASARYNPKYQGSSIGHKDNKFDGGKWFYAVKQVAFELAYLEQQKSLDAVKADTVRAVQSLSTVT